MQLTPPPKKKLNGGSLDAPVLDRPKTMTTNSLVIIFDTLCDVGKGGRGITDFSSHIKAFTLHANTPPPFAYFSFKLCSYL